VEYWKNYISKGGRLVTSFLHCALYLAATGIGAFFLGRLLPKTWFRGDAFPYRCYPSEQKLFRVLHIKDWQSRVPDMSRILPGLMPAKKLTAETFSDLPRMIQETCVAEMIHVLLSLTGLGCLVIWPGIGGVLVTAVYILLGNLPFILIQRYNRPRLQRLLTLQCRKQERKCQDAHTDTKLQYRRGA
jgi:glycosyl-4,4'-diaponeurosporenoate acyltransferase